MYLISQIKCKSHHIRSNLDIFRYGKVHVTLFLLGLCKLFNIANAEKKQHTWSKPAVFFSKPTKSRKSRSHSSRPSKKTGSPKTPKKRSASAKSTKDEVDILSPAAMENVYYISHNAVDCLEFRGFGWPHSKKKRKKKKGTKRKKKK